MATNLEVHETAAAMAALIGLARGLGQARHHPPFQARPEHTALLQSSMDAAGTAEVAEPVPSSDQPAGFRATYNQAVGRTVHDCIAAAATTPAAAAAAFAARLMDDYLLQARLCHVRTHRRPQSARLESPIQ